VHLGSALSDWIGLDSPGPDCTLPDLTFPDHTSTKPDQTRPQRLLILSPCSLFSLFSIHVSGPIVPYMLHREALPFRSSPHLTSPAVCLKANIPPYSIKQQRGMCLGGNRMRMRPRPPWCPCTNRALAGGQAFSQSFAGRRRSKISTGLLGMLGWGRKGAFQVALSQIVRPLAPCKN
jgi:hypothetical protein